MAVPIRDVRNEYTLALIESTSAPLNVNVAAVASNYVRGSVAPVSNAGDLGTLLLLDGNTTNTYVSLSGNQGGADDGTLRTVEATETNATHLQDESVSIANDRGVQILVKGGGTYSSPATGAGASSDKTVRVMPALEGNPTVLNGGSYSPTEYGALVLARETTTNTYAPPTLTSGRLQTDTVVSSGTLTSITNDVKVINAPATTLAVTNPALGVTGIGTEVGAQRVVMAIETDPSVKDGDAYSAGVDYGALMLAHETVGNTYAPPTLTAGRLQTDTVVSSGTLTSITNDVKVINAPATTLAVTNPALGVTGIGTEVGAQRVVMAIETDPSVKDGDAYSAGVDYGALMLAHETVGNTYAPPTLTSGRLQTDTVVSSGTLTSITNTVTVQNTTLSVTGQGAATGAQRVVLADETNPVHADGSAYASGDRGAFALAVETNTSTYAPLELVSGRLQVDAVAVAGGTDSTKLEDSAHASGDRGTFVLGVRNDYASTTMTSANGDYTPLSTDSTGSLHVVTRPYHNNFDATGRQEISTPLTTGDYSFITNLVASPATTTRSRFTTVVDAGANGSYAHDTATNSALLSINTTAANRWAILQTRQSHPYFNGKAQQIEFSMWSFATAASQDIVKRAGYFFYYSLATPNPLTTPIDGMYLESTNGVVSLNIQRRGTSILTVPQSSWNADTLATIDWNNFNAFLFDFRDLGGAVFRLWALIDGRRVLAHQFVFANTAPNVFVGSPNQPLTFSVHAPSTSTTAATLNFACAQVSSLGVDSSLFGTSHSWTIPLLTSGFTRGVWYGIFGLRLAKSAGTPDARCTVLYPTHFYLSSFTSTIQYSFAVVMNPTLAGGSPAPTWLAFGSETFVEYAQFGVTNPFFVQPTPERVITSGSAVGSAAVSSIAGPRERLGVPVDMALAWDTMWLMIFIHGGGGPVSNMTGSFSFTLFH